MKEIQRKNTALIKPHHRKLTRNYFNDAMMRLEAGKVQNFTPQTLETWFREMNRLGWDDVKLGHRCLAVMQLDMSMRRKEITFDDFLYAPAAKGANELYSDAYRIAMNMIEKNRTECEKVKISREEIKKIGYIQAKDEYQFQLQQKLEEWQAEETQRTKEMRKRIGDLDMTSLMKLYAIAIKKKLIMNDTLISKEKSRLVTVLRLVFIDIEDEVKVQINSIK